MADNRIKSIDSFSPLSGQCVPGDRVLAINGNKIIDVLDYKFYAYDTSLDVLLSREDGTEYSVHVEKAEGGDLGLDFESYLMDSPRSCANSCIFCFIDQLPKGMRKTMYFKDDDARLSFLLGNYITLTNLSDREVQRIIDLRVSPVNVSVHTTDPELRCAMLRNPRAGKSLDIMRKFADNGIVMNCQIVCCPGINDGQQLMKSMADLSSMYPYVRSVSVVPVGLTRFREGLYELAPFTPEHAAETIDMVTAFGDKCIENYGSRIFFCGDELYLKAGREIPEDSFYEEYVQLENGVGMLRLLETEFMSALRLSDEPDKPQSFSVAAGVAAAPLLEKLVKAVGEKYDNMKGKVYAIENDFFGRSVTVSGLVTGGDLIAQLKEKPLGDRLLITRNMIRREEKDFLDDVSLAEASARLGVPVIPVEQDGFELLDAMLGLNDGMDRDECSEGMPGGEEFYRYN
ncbi:MAG: DUF512 domain-containing protein [Eubacteriales bacterium]|nr:DUF512 domain-containing protein [Eubacteriales bacterium]